MSAARLVWHELRFDLKTFRRSPAALFFALVLPVMFLVVFVSIFGNDTIELPGLKLVKGSTYYVPGIVTLGVISATFTNLAISLTASRERGLLKRVRKTPLPAWVFMAGRTAASVAASMLVVVVLVGLGRLAYGVAVPRAALAGVLLAIVIGGLAFSALGFALSGAIPSENAATPIANAIILPLYFISGIFIPDEQIPDNVRRVAGVFPVKALYDAFLTAFDPATAGVGVDWGALGVVAAWGTAGAIVAAWTFRWSPRSG
jgi:ABC-2 type transport system permease protein